MRPPIKNITQLKYRNTSGTRVCDVGHMETVVLVSAMSCIELTEFSVGLGFEYAYMF